MNPEKSFKPGLPRLLLTALCGSLLAALPAQAQISVIADANNGITDNSSFNTNTIAGFTVASGSDRKLVLAASWENGDTSIAATWNGTENFTVAVNSALGRNSAILYLDDPTPGTGDIVVTFGANTGSRVGVVSLEGAADGVAVTSISTGITGSLVVPVNGSFVVGAYTSNTTPTFVDPPPFTTTLYTGSSGSSVGNAGYQIEPSAGLQTYTWTSTGGSSDNNALAAFVPVTAAPVLVSTTPADNATDVAVGADLVATFSEPVVAGTGNVELWQVGGGSPIESFNVSPLSSQLTFSGQTLTINPTSNLTFGVEHYVLIASTAVVDTSGGDAFAGISVPTAWSFTADGTAPTLVTLNPADDAPAVRISSNLVATFSEPVFAGSGDIELRQAGGSLVESFEVTTEVTFSGATLTIDPSADLTPGVGYYVLIPATAVVDASNLAFTGITDPTAWSFTADGTPPTIVTLSPADNQGFVTVDANLVATFSETLAVGTGNIELWKTGDLSPLETFEVTTEVTFSGATLTINPTANLDTSTAYHVIIPATAVKDLSGNFFNGLTTATDWNFTTNDPPPVITFLNSANFIDGAAYPDSKTYTKAFDPDDAADALVVILTTEAQGATVDVTWDGVPMTQVFPLAGNDPVGVYYLNNPATLTSANIEATVTRNPAGGNINGIGLTVMALGNSGNFPIAPTAYLIQTGANAVEPINLSVASDGSFVVAGFSSSDGVGAANITASANLTQLLKSDLGSVQGFFGYEENVSAGTNVYQFSYPGAKTFATAVAFAAVPTPANTFADWIAAYDVGSLDGLGDDPDGDGTDNGVENFFGTGPDAFSGGLVAGTATGGTTFTFTHPQGADPASDLTPAYKWSTNLVDWYDGDNVDGPGGGLTVGIVAAPVGPPTTTVTATASQAVPKLFLRVEVSQN
jgi:methionine-rich copper-binding protein CopC